MRQQSCHIGDVRLLVSAHDAHIFLLAPVAELQTVLQRDNATADEILKNLMPVMMTGSLVKEGDKGILMVDGVFHGCFR